MKIKKVSKLLIGLSMLGVLGVAPLTSCSAFFEEDGFMITDTHVYTDEETGKVTVTLDTTNEENPNISFTIPGPKNGNGIENVTSVKSEDGTMITVTISYTDPNVPSDTIKIPCGENGKGIKNVEVNKVDGVTTIKFVYTDGTKAGPYSIEDGVDGKDGVGIKDTTIDDFSNPDFIEIHITFTDDRPEKVIKIPRPSNGVSVVSITIDPELSKGPNYVFKVKYSNENVEQITMAKPKGAQWYHGTEDPTSNNTLGVDGDYYLNVGTGYVYAKSNGAWSFVFSMDGSNSYMIHTVKFHKDDGYWYYPEDIGADEFYPLTVKYGKYVDLNSFPVVKKEGYTFAGWFTHKTKVNAGQFTDLTPVQRDMDLYPRWTLNA